MTNKKIILQIINKVIIATIKIKFLNKKHNKYR